MKLVPKAQYGRGLVALSDNTRVAKPVIERKIEYKLKPGEFFFTDRHTGKKTLIEPKNETIDTYRRTIYQEKLDEKRSQQLRRLYEKDKEWEGGMKNLLGILTFVSPSTYIGPIFNNNGKSYAENVMSGEGTGDIAGNVAIDILTPFAIGGATKVSSRLLPKTVTVYKGGIKSLIYKDMKGLIPSKGTEYAVWKPKLIKAISNKPKEFKSELDWSPKSWFEDAGDWRDYTLTDIDALASHIPEYHKIERISKANGTWLKMPDGSTWKGDPRSWVLLMSKDGLKLSKTVYWHGDTNKYITTSGEDVTPIENGKRILWGNSEPHIARSYTNSDSKVMPFVLKANLLPLREIDAEGRIWKSAYKKNGEYHDTNTFSLENLKNDEYLVINNVIDKGSMFVPKNSKYYISSLPNESYTDYLIRTQKGNDIIVGKNTPRKFLVGNNGNFNLLDPNVFRIGVPIITFSAYDKFSK